MIETRAVASEGGCAAGYTMSRSSDCLGADPLRTVSSQTSTFESLRTRLAGISAVPVTPFDGEGDVDDRALQRVVGRIAAAGIEVVVACGNTAEQASLTDAEAAHATSP